MMVMNFKFRVPNFLKSVRHVLAIVNGVFLVNGVLLLYVGIAVLVRYSEYEELITNRFFNIAGFVIATAVVILLGSVLGCYGAYSRHFYVVAAFQCCGVVNRFDWIFSQIPVACCYVDYGTVESFECTIANAYNLGCANALGEHLAYQAYVIAVSATVATCIQVILASLTAYMTWRVKYEEAERESFRAHWLRPPIWTIKLSTGTENKK